MAAEGMEGMGCLGWLTMRRVTSGVGGETTAFDERVTLRGGVDGPSILEIENVSTTVCRST